MKEVFEWIVVAFITVISIAISVTIMPLISLLIGYWVGFVTEWLANDMLLINDIPELMATIFFIASAIAMIFKTNISIKDE